MAALAPATPRPTTPSAFQLLAGWNKKYDAWVDSAGLVRAADLPANDAALTVRPGTWRLAPGTEHRAPGTGLAWQVRVLTHASAGPREALSRHLKPLAR
jgi:hypothetical protein